MWNSQFFLFCHVSRDGLEVRFAIFVDGNTDVVRPQVICVRSLGYLEGLRASVQIEW